MRLVLSRKGFDTGAGGCPSPVLPDGRLVSLPIPDARSGVRYDEVDSGAGSLGGVVGALTRGRVGARDFAHVDPDVRRSSLPRARGWRAVFGQEGAALSHLRNQGVGVGDVFLFFGLFRRARFVDGVIGWERGSRAFHALWGWLSVGEVVWPASCDRGRYAWAKRHPHFARGDAPNNAVFVCGDGVAGRDGLSGAGVFERLDEALVLTDAAARTASAWSLPGWFRPGRGRPALSYHSDVSRWTRARAGGGDRVLLRAASRGQEFVLDCGAYPEAVGWAAGLIERFGVGWRGA